jgi:hypothetical protein
VKTHGVLCSHEVEPLLGLPVQRMCWLEGTLGDPGLLGGDDGV